MQYEVPMYDIITQRKIASILRSLDDKIELNNAINNNLEQQAQSLFKAWFVDYEPFDGIQPDGWINTTLGKVTINCREKVKSQTSPVFSAINTGCLQLSDEFFTKRVYSKDISRYLLVKEGMFAYNPARINIGSIGINEFGYEGCVSPIYIAFMVDPDYEAFFRFYFKTPYFAESCRVRGSGSVRQSLNYDDFALIDICYPSREYASKFNILWHSLFSIIRQIQDETFKLIILRDTLLPKLMSGELDVSNIDL